MGKGPPRDPAVNQRMHGHGERTASRSCCWKAMAAT